MRLLLLLTSHNSLSQRLTTILDDLSSTHKKGPSFDPTADSSKGLTYTIEYALDEQTMVDAVQKVQPDVIIGAFLTRKVPKSIWSKYMTLILHPGPPGDAGPSAIDWALMGDTGVYEDPKDALAKDCLGTETRSAGRTQWGVTCLQADEEFDSGPIWAFETFDIPPDSTKSSLYRGPVTQAACLCIITALNRIEQAAEAVPLDPSSTGKRYSADLKAPESACRITVSGKVNAIDNPRHRPLLRPAERAVDPTKHTASHCATIIRAGDSQPGVQVQWLDYDNKKKSLFLYGAWVENGDLPGHCFGGNWDNVLVGHIAAIREGAILVKCAIDPEKPEDRGIWVTHARSPMSKDTRELPPKICAVDALNKAGLGRALRDVQEWPNATWNKLNGPDGRKTWQQVWIEKDLLVGQEGGTVLYVHFDFYNGACSTEQCQTLLAAILDSVNSDSSIKILCLMGSRNYFSNGIALNTVQASSNAAKASWQNINAIDDIVEYILGDSSPKSKEQASPFMKAHPTLTSRNILTISAIRSNAAAGGLALATCCDIVLCANNAVLNPHYRSIGLFGSEFHRFHWVQRMGKEKSESIMRGMLPMSSREAKDIGLVDHILGSRASTPADIDRDIKAYIQALAIARAGEETHFKSAPWLKPTSAPDARVSPIAPLINHLVALKKQFHSRLEHPLVSYRSEELSQMLLDFYHPTRSLRYHTRRRAFIGKHKANSTPLRFAEHNRSPRQFDEEEHDMFDAAPAWERGKEWIWVGKDAPSGFMDYQPFRIDTGPSPADYGSEGHWALKTTQLVSDPTVPASVGGIDSTLCYAGEAGISV